MKKIKLGNETIVLLDMYEAAERLGINYRTVRKWVINGSLRAQQLGKKYWIHEKDLSEFILKRGIR
ncbi:MAG: excisionase family DNA-binding protein [Candidatus Moraniibacteriota bacterium]